MVSQTAYNFQKPHVKTDSGNGKFWSETATVFGKRELAHSLLSWENKAAHHQQEFLGIPSPPPGFYLGYLRGRSFPHPPPKMPSFPSKKLILLSLQCSVTISSLQVTAHTVILLQIVSQNAPNCISAHIHFKNFGEGACPWTTLGSSWPSATRDFSPKR